MIRYITFLLTLFCITSLSGQDSRNQLFQLECRSNAFNAILSDINSFIAGKSNGFIYPVSKVLIYSFEDNSVEMEIQGIDNSWFGLFNPYEIPYGFMIVDSRLFVVSSMNTDEAFLANIFRTTEHSKIFNMENQSLPSTARTPKWYYELKGPKYIWLGGEDLDTLK